jgi:chromosome partitioning protein
MGSGVDKNALEYSMNDLLQGKVSVEDCIIEQTPAGYDLLPANSDLTAAEVVLLKKQGKPTVLAHALASIKDQYDYIFLDCPPSLNMLTVNALVASDAVIIPMQCEYYALEGLTDLVNTLKQLRDTLNPKLHVKGIIRTMYDGRNRLAAEVSSQLIDHFGNKVFQTVIPRNVRLAEAPSYGLPVQLYDKHSRGSTAYLALAGELLRRDKNTARKEKAKQTV